MNFAMPLFGSALAVSIASAAPVQNAIMPAPAEMRMEDGRLPIDAGLTVAIRGVDDARVTAELGRMLQRWQERTGYTFAHTATGSFAISRGAAAAVATLTVDTARRSPEIPALGDDESYTLDVAPHAAALHAHTTVGAQRGLQTILLLLQSDDRGWFLPAVRISDHPRFAWRGLMIDVCRHWQPMEVIKRNLDGMALVKLNVLHLHLSDDQGFRIESRRYPRLQEAGSDGHFFTQEQMRDIIAYAAARGIRVVPEFDIPGHATSWVVGFPALASAPGPYAIERKWGVFNPVLDPANEKTYALLDGFLGEMAALFPDPYLHIGGDENNGVQWNANPRIQAFVREHRLKDNGGLHAYFNQRVRAILQRHGKKMIGWDEILHPDLPRDSVIQSWRGAKGLADAASQGFTAILSNGYYIDLCHSAATHYRNDPLPADTTLTPEQQRLVLGGEATMWSEWVTPETIDSRIWPRTAAIAERLWSPRDVNDVTDMYRRLALLSARLEDAGLQHERNRPAMVRRFAGRRAPEELVRNLDILVDLIEPVKDYQRGQQQPEATQFTPLTGLVDCARPESEAARVLTGRVESVLSQTNDPQQRAAAVPAIRSTLSTWRAAGESIIAHATEGSLRVEKEAVPIARALVVATGLALQAVDNVAAHGPVDEQWYRTAEAELDRNAQPHAAAELAVLKPIRALIDAGGGHR
jgi:hexosaminidase